jgi:16S rRNA U516 pseudouridylate synthase RsuA-like enzyme
VKKLHRIAIGSIQLNRPGQPKLPQGQYRLLTEPEIRCLKQESQFTLMQAKETAVTSSMCHHHSC